MDSQENPVHLLVNEGQLVTCTFVWVVFTHNALSCSPLPAFGPLKVQEHEGEKKRCKISNLHYRARSDSLPTICVFARAYLCTRTFIRCVCGGKRYVFTGYDSVPGEAN